MIQETSNNSPTGTPRDEGSSAIPCPPTAASESQVSIRMDDAENSVQDEQVADNDDDDGGVDEEIEEVMEIDETESDTDVRPTTSAPTSVVSETHSLYRSYILLVYDIIVKDWDI